MQHRWSGFVTGRRLSWSLHSNENGRGLSDERSVDLPHGVEIPTPLTRAAIGQLANTYSPPPPIDDSNQPLTWEARHSALIALMPQETTVVVEPDPPAPTRRLLPKSVVQARLDATGKWEAVASLLFSEGLPNIYYARWFAPDWPNVYFDDPDLLLILLAAGCTPSEVASITAPYP